MTSAYQTAIQPARDWSWFYGRCDAYDTHDVIKSGSAMPCYKATLPDRYTRNVQLSVKFDVPWSAKFRKKYLGYFERENDLAL